MSHQPLTSPMATYLNNLDATSNLVLQLMNKFSGGTVIDADYTINPSQNHPIQGFSGKCDLKRYVDGHSMFVMPDALHGTERIEVDSVR